MPFKFLEHTADIKIQVTEKTMEKAFATSAIAMREVMAEKIKVKAEISKEISIKEKDLSALLYSFLEEFLYLHDAKNFLLAKVEKVEIEEDETGFSLEAEFTGGRVSSHKFINPVKAVTYNEMRIGKHKNKFVIEFILDV